MMTFLDQVESPLGDRIRTSSHRRSRSGRQNKAPTWSRLSCSRSGLVLLRRIAFVPHLVDTLQGHRVCTPWRRQRSNCRPGKSLVSMSRSRRRSPVRCMCTRLLLSLKRSSRPGKGCNQRIRFRSRRDPPGMRDSLPDYRAGASSPHYPRGSGQPGLNK